MNKILLNHFEKIIFGIIIIICLFMIIQDVRKFISKRKSEEEFGDMRRRIMDVIEDNAPPALPEIMKYGEVLQDRLEGITVLTMNSVPQGLVYPREMARLVPIEQKPRFVILPPLAPSDANPDAVKVQGGYQIVDLLFQTDSRVPSFVINQSRPVVEGQPTYQGQFGVSFGAVIQRRMVHDGKAAVEGPWKTLTGTEASPRWEELEKPMTTTLFLKADPEFDQKKAGPVMNEMAADPNYDPDRYADQMRPTPTEGFGRGGQWPQTLGFAFSDTGVEAFRTYQYRFATAGAVQEGVRVFTRPATAEDLRKDDQAIRTFEEDLYDLGLDFFGNPKLIKDQLADFGVTTLIQKTAMDEKGTVKADAAFYLVLSDWTDPFDAQVATDTEVFLSGSLGESVSVYVLKHYRYLFKVEEPEQTGAAKPKDGKDKAVYDTAWVDLLVNFTHVKGDRIGAGARSIAGHRFFDREKREVDFTTPYVLVGIGRGDRVNIKEVEEWVNEKGKLQLMKVKKEFVERDVLFVEAKNIYTDEVTKLWLAGGEVIMDVRRRAAEAEAAARKLAEERAAARARVRSPRTSTPSDRQGAGSGSSQPPPGGPSDDRAPKQDDGVVR